MKDAPHIVVRAFERLILFSLGLCLLVDGIITLIERAWLFGSFLLLMSFVPGMVGQALPHRKKQTAREIYSQNVGERYGDMTREESMGLARAVLLSSFLVSVIAAGTAINRELPWHWVLVYFVGAWAVFPLGSILSCFGWAWVMEKKFGSARPQP